MIAGTGSIPRPGADSVTMSSVISPGAKPYDRPGLASALPDKGETGPPRLFVGEMSPNLLHAFLPPVAGQVTLTETRVSPKVGGAEVTARWGRYVLVVSSNVSSLVASDQDTLEPVAAFDLPAPRPEKPGDIEDLWPYNLVIDGDTPRSASRTTGST
ncbi:MAG: hypothetical protein QOF60_1082 [Actinomycetota bacterium]|nr:hypothetical protein [Actinomycetota bacterium]